MIFTVTAGSQIKKVFSTGKRELAELQLSAGEVLHAGNYQPSEYQYDEGSGEFTPLEQAKKTALIEKPNKQIISTLISEMISQGYKLPAFDYDIRTKAEAYNAVNLEVSTACERYVSPGKYTNFIYLFKEQAARQWIAGGSVESEAPELLLSWFDNSEHSTLSDAAANIIGKAEYMRGKIESVERTRLEARKAILAATSDYAEVIKPYIEALQAI